MRRFKSTDRCWGYGELSERNVGEEKEAFRKSLAELESSV